jgi:UDP-glucose 4-epimerase
MDCSLMVERCLVLGGKGFIGSHLVKTLLAAGKTVRVFDRAEAESLLAPDVRAQVEMIEGDFADFACIAAALAGCDICFHLISTTLPKSSNDDPHYDVQSNLIGTIQLLEQARHTGLQKIIFLSSGGTVYGVPQYCPIDEAHPTDPLCSYGITKLAIEKYLALYHALHGIDYSVLRVSNPYGEGQRLAASQGAVAVFLGRVLHQEKLVIWGDGSVARDYVYIGDLMDAVLATLHYTGSEHVFNIGSGVPTTLLALIETIEAMSGKQAEVEFMPARGLDVPLNVLDISRAHRELGWQPKISLLDGLFRMQNWIRR